MSFPTTLDIARGIPGGRVVRQFGRNTAVVGTFAPIARGGMLLLEEFPTVEGVNDFVYDPPIRLPALTDYGFLGKSDSGTIDVCVAFEGVEVIPT